MKTGVYYNSYSTSASSLKSELSTASAWTKISIDFTIIELTSVELGVYFTRSTSEAIACADNVKLMYSNYTAELSSMIARATALSNASLASAISTAQDVLDNVANTVAYQTDIDNAVSTLQAAIIAAQNTNGSALTAAVKNPGFEGAQMWYVKTKGADTYHADAWMNSSPFTSEVYHYSTTTTDQKSEGSQSYKVRFNWADASAELSQTIPGLSLGRYVITADMKATNGSKSSIEAYIKGNSTKGESVTAATSGFQTISATVDLNEAGNLDIILGMDYKFTGGSTTSEAIMYWDNITLTYYNPAELYNSTKSDAQDTYNDSEYNNVTGNERTALYNLLNPDPAPSTVEEYFEAIDDINDAVAAFTAAKTSYDKYAAEAANAVAIGVDPVPALDVASNYSAKLKALIVLEDAAVKSGYPEDATEVVGEWTPQNIATDNTDHWSGTTQTYYNKWNGSGFTMSLSKTVSLPAGSYVLKAAARCYNVNNEDNFYLGVTPSGRDLIKEIYTSTGGSTGLGIDKTGAANYTATDETYANDNNGYGWEWRFVHFSLDATTNVDLKITADILANGWVSFSDIALLTTSSNIDVFEQIYNTAKDAATTARDNKTYENVDGSEKKALTDAINAVAPVPATLAWYKTQASTLKSATATFTSSDVKTAYDNLASKISSANGIVTNSINVGEEPFQVPTSIRTALNTAKEEAESTKSNVATTSSIAAAAATTLNTAISTYNTNFADAELNAPEESTPYNLYLADGGASYANNLTFKDGNATSGTYAMTFAESNNSFNQAVHFKAVAEQKNKYYLYIIDAEGNKHYICTGAVYDGGNNNQIRVTDTEANALAVLLVASSTENGAYNLKNTASSDNLIGTSDGGFYTTTKYNKFNINAASQASIDVIITSAEVGTTILPFEADIPDGIDAYSVTDVVSDILQLEKVTTGKFAVNVPYLIAGSETTKKLSGYGLAKKNSYDDGLLTGVFVNTTVPVGSYVLQNQIEVDGVAFYVVTSGNQPTAKSNRCYLTLDGGVGGARALHFNFDETNSVETIKALTAGKNTIYNAAGKVVPSLQKGLNIIKTSDGKIRKVIVK